MRVQGWVCALLLGCCFAGTAQGSGRMRLDLGSMPPDAQRLVRVEVVRAAVSDQLSAVSYGGDAGAISTVGVELPAGSYNVYLEHEATGLIQAYDDGGAGYAVADGQTVTVVAADFAAKIQEVQVKDKADRERLRLPGPPATQAVGEPRTGGAPSGPRRAPGELLLKFAPGTTLAQRRQLLQELASESRSKLRQLDVYRVKVDEQADLEALVQRFAADPRLKYIETNQVMSVPEPVEGDARQ